MSQQVTWEETVSTLEALGAVQTEFRLRVSRGVEPPARVEDANKEGRVSLNILQGEFYLWTANDEPLSFSLTKFMLDRTDPTYSTGHRFIGSVYSPAGGTEALGEIVGFAFLAKYCSWTWFAPFKGMHFPGIGAPTGTIHFKKKRKKKPGPDYISAPFDPSEADPGNALFAVEFKARNGHRDFKHQEFKGWRRQSKNIRAEQDGKKRALKAWVSCFNYACRDGKKDRKSSVLLVDDPWTEDAAIPPFGGQEIGADFIIREHLARMATKVGAAQLAGPILQGRRLRVPLPLFTVDHPRFRGRLFTGRWGFLDGAGQLHRDPLEHYNWSTAPEGYFLVWYHPAGIWVTETPSQPTRRVFLGQDARMIIACTAVPAGEPLHSLFPEEADDVHGRLDLNSGPAFVMSSRSGALFATANAVTPASPDTYEDLYRSVGGSMGR